MDLKTEDFVNVAIRIRPSRNILEEPKGIELISENPSVLYVVDRQQSYIFDNVFSKNASQEEVYNKIVKPFTKRVLLGYNCTIFAYGQTGTGKTYTVGCDPDYSGDAGFIPRTLDDLFSNEEYNVDSLAVSFYEIYKEKVYDLLGNNKIALPVKGFKVQGLTEQKVTSSKEACALLKLGSSLRHTGETKQNTSSSRSHAIFTIHCVAHHDDRKTVAKFNLVDLAGSESLRKTGNEGVQLLEGIHINKGLFYIGRVMNALSDNKLHVPHRQSMITTILKDSLHKTNYVTLVACVSPDIQDATETVQTLDFAQNTKKIKNNPEINHIVQEFKSNNPSLFDKQLGSAIKGRPTSLKRFHSLQCEESDSKRVKIDNTWTPIRESHEESLYTANTTNQLSRIVELKTPTLQSLSPLVRKCAQELQTKMMEKLEVLMKTHFTRGSLGSAKNFTTESTSAKSLRSAKMMSLAGQTPMASSSPIVDLESDTIFGDESVLEKANMNVKKRLECGDSLIQFKVPKALPRRNIRSKAESLQINNASTVPILNESLEGTFIQPRRSVRLSMKRTSILPSIDTNSPYKRRQSSCLSVLSKNNSPKPMPRVKVAKARGMPHKKKNAKSVVDNSKFNISPGGDYEKHAASVLYVLNNGSMAELQKLPMIGPKTATQIYLHRQLNGHFSNINDLKEMECWKTTTTYQRFLRANLLKNND